MNIQPQEFETIKRLADKNSWVTGLLTVFLLPAGYIYTGRFKAMFIGFGITVGMTAFCLAGDPSLENDEDFNTGVGFLYLIGSTIDNTRAVNHAKKRLQNLQQFSNLPPNLVQDEQPHPNLKITLLKLAKQQVEVTVADCVIETGQDTKRVRQVLQELINEELMMVTNRDSDGAVVYRVI